jgi:RNA-directed DNA polymerase
MFESEAQAAPTAGGILWLGFVVYPAKQRNFVNFTRRLERKLDLYEAEQISFAELDARVQGWINYMRYADTWDCESIFSVRTDPPA